MSLHWSKYTPSTTEDYEEGERMMMMMMMTVTIEEEMEKRERKKKKETERFILAGGFRGSCP
jgi:hypothetical protein